MFLAHLYRLSTLALVLGTVATAGCSRSAAVKDKDLPRVTVAHPVVEEVPDEDDFNGWIEAYKTVDVRSRVRGHIKEVLFTEGEEVQVGQPLFQLDPAPFQVERDQAVAQAKALEAQKAAAEKDVARYTELLKSGGASKQQLDKADADAKSYDAQIAAKAEEVKRHDLDLKFARITADQKGKIGKAVLTEGNFVDAGGEVLATIRDASQVRVCFSIDERKLQQYQNAAPAPRDAGQKVSLRKLKVPFNFGLDTEKGFPHDGTIEFTGNEIVSGTGTIQVYGVAENKEGKFVPGSRARVRLATSEKRKVVLVPDSALLADQDKRYLLVLGKDNIVVRRDVPSGGRLLDDGRRVVLPEPGKSPVVGPGDWIITLGLQRARINDPVQPMDANGQPVDTAAVSDAAQKSQ